MRAGSPLLDATEQEPLQRSERPLEVGDRNLLVGGVRVTGPAGAEIERVETAGREDPAGHTDR